MSQQKKNHAEKRLSFSPRSAAGVSPGARTCTVRRNSYRPGGAGFRDRAPRAGASPRAAALRPCHLRFFFSSFLLESCLLRLLLSDLCRLDSFFASFFLLFLLSLLLSFFSLSFLLSFLLLLSRFCAEPPSASSCARLLLAAPPAATAAAAEVSPSGRFREGSGKVQGRFRGMVRPRSRLRPRSRSPRPRPSPARARHTAPR